MGETLEPPLGKAIAGPVPTGQYKASIYLSPRFGREVILLHNVPNRPYIEIHAGNYATDTEGCILVGATRSIGMITHSRHTLDQIIHSLKTPNQIMVEIR